MGVVKGWKDILREARQAEKVAVRLKLNPILLTGSDAEAWEELTKVRKEFGKADLHVDPNLFVGEEST